jgi:iron(III) transport system substrate-binding protein
MHTRRRLAPCLAALAALALAAPAIAADDALMRAAKKEGKVTWYTAVATAQAQEVCKAFNDKKLGVNCIVHRDGSGPLYRRYLQEAKSGVHVADVFHTANIGHFLNLRKNDLAAYQPKGIEKFHPAFRTDHGYWSIWRATVIVPFYNTRKVAEADAPKNWKDLLDPKWRGKLVQAHPGYAGNIVYLMLSVMQVSGNDYFQKLSALKPKITQSSLAPIPLVSRGEADLATGSPLYAIMNDMKKGEPLRPVFPPEGMPINPMPTGIIKKAPNPNAAKVFTDFLFSREAQQLLATRNLYVGHPDAKYPQGLPAPKDLKIINIPPEEMQKRTKEVVDLFRKLFGV